MGEPVNCWIESSTAYACVALYPAGTWMYTRANPNTERCSYSFSFLKSNLLSTRWRCNKKTSVLLISRQLQNRHRNSGSWLRLQGWRRSNWDPDISRKTTETEPSAATSQPRTWKSGTMLGTVHRIESIDINDGVGEPQFCP